jgi:hypothetical protein
MGVVKLASTMARKPATRTKRPQVNRHAHAAGESPATPPAPAPAAPAAVEPAAPAAPAELRRSGKRLPPGASPWGTGRGTRLPQ